MSVSLFIVILRNFHRDFLAALAIKRLTKAEWQATVKHEAKAELVYNMLNSLIIQPSPLIEV